MTDFSRQVCVYPRYYLVFNLVWSSVIATLFRRKTLHPARSLTGFFAAGPPRLASLASSLAGDGATITTTTTTRTSAAAAATVPSTSGNQATAAGGKGGPPAVTAEVLSPRKVALGLPIPDPEARCGFSVKWFEEGNASVFDKVKENMILTVNIEPFCVRGL